jgi:hypothetical protein
MTDFFQNLTYSSHLVQHFLIDAVETAVLNSIRTSGSCNSVLRNRSPDFYSEDFTVNANFYSLRGTFINRWKQRLFT